MLARMRRIVARNPLGYLDGYFAEWRGEMGRERRRQAGEPHDMGGAEQDDAAGVRRHGPEGARRDRAGVDVAGVRRDDRLGWSRRRRALQQLRNDGAQLVRLARIEAPGHRFSPDVRHCTASIPPACDVGRARCHRLDACCARGERWATSSPCEGAAERHATEPNLLVVRRDLRVGASGARRAGVGYTAHSSRGSGKALRDVAPLGSGRRLSDGGELVTRRSDRRRSVDHLSSERVVGLRARASREPNDVLRSVRPDPRQPARAIERADGTAEYRRRNQRRRSAASRRARRRSRRPHLREGEPRRRARGALPGLLAGRRWSRLVQPRIAEPVRNGRFLGVRAGRFPDEHLGRAGRRGGCGDALLSRSAVVAPRRDPRFPVPGDLPAQRGPDPAGHGNTVAVHRLHGHGGRRRVGALLGRTMRFLLAIALLAPAAVAEEGGDVQRVHVVEKRPFNEASRFELSVFGLGQVNPRFTVHAGIGAELSYHLRENLAAQIGASYNAIAHQSALTEELAAKVDQQPLAANALLLQAAVLAGLELMPIYGKISIFGGNVLRLGLYMNAGI